MAGFVDVLNEGGEMNNLVFTHLSTTNVPRPLFLTFCQKNAWVDAPSNELPPMKSVRNLQFNDITVNNETGSKNSAFVIVGLPGHPVENVSLHNIRATFLGGGTQRDLTNSVPVAELTPENLGNRWPEIGNLRRIVPARGLYARPVRGISLNHVDFTTQAPDLRSPVVFDDVTGVTTSDSPEPVTAP